MHLRLIRFLILFCLLPGIPAHAQNTEITLSIAGHKLRAEIAATPDERMRGLMFRTELAENRGMLFVYPQPSLQAMWMMNTIIPLSVAFIGRDGRILNIEDMAPQTKDAHPSQGAAAYSLEMNQGWFAARGIGRGTLVEGLEAAPRAQ